VREITTFANNIVSKDQKVVGTQVKL